MGGALAAALTRAGAEVTLAAGREGAAIPASAADVVLLAVPDAAIAETAARVGAGPLVGHLSGATGLRSLAPHEAFGLHPLLTVTGPEARFDGASAAIAGSTPRALRVARDLAAALGLRAFEVAEEDRAAYHAAASVASNFLVVVEGLAEELAGTAGVSRDALAPLVRAAVENWVRSGASAALTGPVARGDEATVERQRAAVAERLPDRLPLFDALVAATRELAARSAGGARSDPGQDRRAGRDVGSTPRGTSSRADRTGRDGAPA
ncbi:DUF2520 domain-containing protein [Leucobacter sp. CSA1]|uniref:DUF2520 domain-containing protein n=2 Tax=Leucobacter chromiisoli TaxID=2796471 RepID=A0A934Q7Y0_9MICO|nr:DUF2520 domain-containing protein [Leucobacter chromiisoli]